eukprot:jgi/Ulvmu1/8097/UM004_0336.1
MQSHAGEIQHQHVQIPAAKLEACSSLLLSGVRAALMKEELQQLLESINTIVADGWEPGQAGNDIQMCHCIKPDINKFLDAARDRFNQLSEDLQSQVPSAANTVFLHVANSKVMFGSADLRLRRF